MSARRTASGDVRRMQARRGFTMVELMISLTVGGIAISSIYAISAASSRQFQQQQQIANAQTSLRMALNQVKRDIARAGYLGTPNANAGQYCAQTGAPLDEPLLSGRLAAFSNFQNDVAMTTGVNNGVDPTGNNRANGFTVDDVVLFANYETGSEYPGVSLISTSLIGIGQRWQSFQRDFTAWYQSSDTFDGTAFNDAFTVNRAIRIQTTKGLRHFALITSVTAPGVGTLEPVRVAFDPPIPPDCASDVDGGWAAPLSAIRYFVKNAPGSGDPVAQLIRQEVSPGDKATPLTLANNQQAPARDVIDYVVGFNLGFTMVGATPAGQPDNYAPNAPGVTTNDPAVVNANPERIRAVTIDLAVRAPLADPRLAWTRTGCANLRCFQVSTLNPSDNTSMGAARVRRLRAEVFVPNVAYEGY